MPATFFSAGPSEQAVSRSAVGTIGQSFGIIVFRRWVESFPIDFDESLGVTK